MRDTKILALCFSILFLLAAAGCAGCAPRQSLPPQRSAAPAPLRVAALKGPSGIALVEMMRQNSATGAYSFEFAGAADEIVGKLTSGAAEIAAMPPNLAASLYNKTNGDIQVILLNALGMLYILEAGDTVQSVRDLDGKTVSVSGQGSVPEYALRYVLQKNGLDTRIEFKSEHAELAALLASGDVKLGMLPEPFVTTALTKNAEVRVALDMTREFQTAGSELVMGCFVARKDFAGSAPDRIARFLADFKISAEYVVKNPKEAAALVEEYGMMPAAAAAEKAIPNCNIVYRDGDAMQTSIDAFLKALFELDPKAIGGKLPDAAFYYKAP